MAKAKRWIIAGAGCLAAAALAAPWPAGDDAGRNVIAQFAGAAGLNPLAIGRASVSLLPSPRIRLHGVAISDESRTLLISSGEIEGKLRLLPLIAGRFELSGLTLHEPELTLDLGKFVLADQGAIARTARAPDDSREATQAERERLGAIALVNGRAKIRNSASGPEEVELTDINGTFDWRSPRTPAALGGTAMWRGESYEVAALLARPVALLRGQNSPLNLSLKSAGLRLQLDGELAMLPRWQFAGAFKGSTPDAQVLTRTFGLTLPFIVPAEGTPLKVDIDAASRINAVGLILNGGKFEVESNTLNGSLSILRQDGATAVTATLATSALAIDPRLFGLPRPFADGGSYSPGGWNTEPIDPHMFNTANMDLRLSINELRLGRMVMSDVALSTITQEGRLELSLSSGKAYGGTLKARLGFTGPATPSILRGSLQVENVDAAAFLRDAAGYTRVSGSLTAESEFRATGQNALQMIQNLQGNLQANMQNGAFQGLDLERALQQAQTHPLSLPSEIRSGRTVFARASASGLFENGILKLANTTAESDTLRVSLTGLASLVARRLDLEIEAARPAQSAEARQSDASRPVLRLDLRGPFASPELELDTDSLIDNSEAAAPLGKALPMGRAPQRGNAPAAAPARQ